MSIKTNTKWRKAATFTDRDEVYQANGVAYMETDLKLAHLRIVMTIIKNLQSAIRFKISRKNKGIGIPEALLPVDGGITASGHIRILTIPVSDFHLGINNGGRLRSYLQELSNIKCNFPEKNIKSSSGLRSLNNFSGLILGYSFPAYSSSVEIYLLEEMVGRLLLTEEGYSFYSYNSALTLTNKYTVRIYWLICSWRTKGGFVITLDNFKRLLSLGPAYDRYDNLVARIINPALKDLRSRFSIWFLYRRYDRNGIKRLAFKIKLSVSESERHKMKENARDVCFNLLSSLGAKTDTIDDIFQKVESEDLKPFIAKLTELYTYIKSHPEIKNRDCYIRTSMELWFDDWTMRYCELTEEPDDNIIQHTF